MGGGIHGVGEERPEGGAGAAGQAEVSKGHPALAGSCGQVYPPQYKGKVACACPRGGRRVLSASSTATGASAGYAEAAALNIPLLTGTVIGDDGSPWIWNPLVASQ